MLTFVYTLLDPPGSRFRMLDGILCRIVLSKDGRRKKGGKMHNVVTDFISWLASLVSEVGVGVGALLVGVAALKFVGKYRPRS